MSLGDFKSDLKRKIKSKGVKVVNAIHDKVK